MRPATARFHGVSVESARTGIHGGYQRKRRRKLHASLCPRDMNAAGLNRPPERLKNMTRKLRQLVQKKHSMMRQADLARPPVLAAADHRRQRDCLMRRPERPVKDQSR